MSNSNPFTGDWHSDNYIMCDILSQVNFYSGTERKNMLKVSPKIGGSMLYGTTWKSYLAPGRTRTPSPYKNLYYTKVVDDYPELDYIFKQFAMIHFPLFEFDQVQMNKNFECPPHKDSSNIGQSVLCCFGEYKNGETMVEYEDHTMCYDAREKPVMFDGSKYLHWVEKVHEGDRYSLVFFKNNKKKRVEKKSN